MNDFPDTSGNICMAVIKVDVVIITSDSPCLWYIWPFICVPIVPWAMHMDWWRAAKSSEVFYDPMGGQGVVRKAP